ncbi:MAG: T9SS type A sorting domain-containing protein [Bacteroidetes bacterium]|nr:T9SS type A sorting domain-containing protein [Bacteroidota bacterium]
MKPSLLLLSLILLSIYGLKAQENAAPTKATEYGIIAAPTLVPSIAQQIKDGTFVGVDPNQEVRPGPPKRRGANKTVPGKGLPVGKDALVQHPDDFMRFPGKAPSLVFNANVSQYTPSDPTGAVGPNHFVGAWNIGFRIFDKQGNPLTPAASLSTLFPGNAIGDPIVLYDAAADRFVITEFDDSPNGFNVAVCQGSDPVNDGWYIYTTGFGTGSFPDYTKFSVWSDGYYVTANISQSNRIFVVQRDQMLLGNPSQFVGLPLPGISTSGFYSPQVFHVTDDNLPASGNASVVYLQDDAWSGVTTDHLKIWTINVDWTNTANSTISAAQQVITTPFISVFDGGSFSNRPQPSGPDQDVLQATIMNQSQYRKFSDHNSVLVNFVVDTDGSSGELAGIRWFELRQPTDGEPWEIYQEGTYTSPNNGKDAFSGSMAMDAQGNIGMGYTTVSTQEKIAIYYTGRYANDPLGLMTIDETLIAQSTTNNPSNRLADYVHLTVDPSNDKTFWHIAEFFVSNNRTDVVGVFQIAPDLTSDVGVVSIDAPVDGSLNSTELVTITVFNFGQTEQSDIPVSYQVDNGTVVNEVVPGPIPSASSVQYTFTATADLGIEGQVYTITAATSLDGDEWLQNDTTVKQVTNLFQNDLAVTAIIRPVSGTGLTATEIVEVTVSNYGAADQADFEVSYDLDGLATAEVVAGPLPSGGSLNYAFTATGDFSAIGSYNLKAYTSLAGDAHPENDTTSVVVVKNTCEPSSDCSYGDGFSQVKLGTFDNVTDCSPGGYGNYLDISTELERNETYELTVTTNYGDQFVRVWIDFNDNYVYEADELVVDNVEIANGQTEGSYTMNIPIAIPEDALLGAHNLRAKSNWNALVPDDACEGTSYGETEDYTVIITLYTGIETAIQDASDLIISPIGNQLYRVSLKTKDVSETLIFNLFNMVGQKLVENRIDQTGGTYEYELDMAYAKPGVYIVRVGNTQFGKVKRLVIQ